MMYSVEDKVQSPKDDERKRANKERLNNDIEAEASGGFSDYESSNAGQTRPKPVHNPYDATEDNLNDRLPAETINRNSHKSTPQNGSNKMPSIHSKGASDQKSIHSRVTHRRVASNQYEGAGKTGQISVAMQILNMDEEEKE
jgi:hypothetical protein